MNFVYWALIADPALMIRGFFTVLSALYTAISEVFRTLPREWVEEILTTEDVSADARTPLKRRSTTAPG